MEFDALRRVIAAVLGVDEDEITPDMDFAYDLGADSLDLYQVFVGVEDELGITIVPDGTPDGIPSGIENITTVKEAVEFIRQNME